MRFSWLFTAVFLLVRTSLAQDDLFSALPDCSVQCFQDNISLSSCSPTDIACLCIDQEFLTATQGCQALSCTVRETLTATNATLAACGVPAQDQSATLIAIPASFGSLAILLVLVRVGGRLLKPDVTLDWDDYLISVSGIFAAVLNGLCFPMAIFGMGKDFWAIPLDDIDSVLMYLYLAMIPYMIAEMFAQLSILAFYIRVFGASSEFVRKGTFVLMSISICFGLANTFSMVFQCTPITFFWTSWAGETTGTCININLFSWIRASIQIAIDVSILSLPLPSLIKLQMNRRKKFQVMLMFALGFVITLVSILRLQSLIQFAQTQNPTYDNSPAVYWSVLECDMFIICACMPALRAIVSHYAPGIFGWSTVDHSYPRSGGYVDVGNSKDPSASHQLSSLDRSGNKGVVYPEERTASDEDLVPTQQRRGHRENSPGPSVSTIAPRD